LVVDVLPLFIQPRFRMSVACYLKQLTKISIFRLVSKEWFIWISF
jgi:hypothetical protein